jgi:uncharacterized FAD-dependent dehydrogenase
MLRLSEIRLPLDHDEGAIAQAAATRLGVPPAHITQLKVFKRSFDARKRPLQVVYIADLALPHPAAEQEALARTGEAQHCAPAPDMTYPLLGLAARAPAVRPVVVGFGPCGIFAALILAQMGLAPIVIERGKPVRQRTKDTWGLWRRHVLHPESNVQFGEGGAGTFSDGKLWSQIRDPRHLGRKVMTEFVAAGAPPEILVEAHPHIGTFKLVKVVEAMREQIIALGGEVRFEERVEDLLIEPDANAPHGRRLVGLRVRRIGAEQDPATASYELPAHHVVLALGHSSRDTFAMLVRQGVYVEPKPFSIGFRVEHPQGMIDRARWGVHAGHPALGAADYKLVHHASNGRSVYSFCMCPGGTVVAATSEVGRVVTNGMSQYSRNERNANAGIVVGIHPSDYPRDPQAFQDALGDTFHVEAQAPDACHPLAGIVLQRQLESNAYALGGASYEAPGQLVGDFLAGRPSTQLGDVEPSYKPGVKLGDLHLALPGYAVAAIQEAMPAFAKKIKGFDRHDAVFTGVETRTSSPLRITRGEDLQSLNLHGLYPAGEGAGYAGGILSAGVDGIRVAEAVGQAMLASH